MYELMIPFWIDYTYVRVQEENIIVVFECVCNYTMPSEEFLQ